MPAQLREGLHTVRRLLLSANPYNPEPFIYPLQRYLHNDHSPYKLSRLVLSQVKIHLRHQLFHGARNFLRERLSQVDWAFSSSSFTLEALHVTPLKVIPPFSRLAILRWIIDSEPDVHFRLRPHFTRSSPCRCGCGKFSSLFPFGFQSGSVHHSHFYFPLTWTLLACPSLFSSFPNFFRDQHPPLRSFTSPPVWYTRHGHETTSLDSLPPPLIRWLSHPCVLCGRGGNSVQHWLNFCPIPALAGSLLLNRPWFTRFWYFTCNHSPGHRSVIASLWVATRQFVHERSGLPPPFLIPPSVSSVNTVALPRLLAERAYQLIPHFFRSHTAFTPSTPSISPNPHSCTFELVHFPTLTLEAEGHPLFYGPVPATSTAVGSDDIIGIFSPSSPLIKKLFAFQRSVARPPNCTLQFKLCSCGSIHGYLQALSPLPNSPLFIGDPDVEQHDLVLHFDGGCFKELQLGGAGVAIWRHTAGSLTLLDTLCIPIYPCPDAAYAEACGAAHAVVLAAKYFAEVRPKRIVIKGDNRPVIDFLNNVGKLRRSDLQSLLDTAQHLMAFSLPPLIWSYTPLEFNRCADFLAGIARDHAREHFAHAPEYMSSLCPFPFPLPPSLSSLFAPVFNPSPSPSTPTFTFTEVSSFPLPLLPLLFRHFKHTPAIICYLRALSNLRMCTLQPLSVLYRPTSSDSYGRLYCSPLGAQKLPKILRSLLFGNTHYEVDLTGSHYQFFSRLARNLLQLPLPSIADLRTLLREDMVATSSDFLPHHPTAPKDLPTILLNSTLGDTVTHYNSLGYYPSFQTLAALRAIHNAKPRVLDAIEHRFGKRTLNTLTSANRPFHILEHVETLWLKHFATYLCQHSDIASLIWLHDGVWISPLPSPTILLAANRAASSHLGLEAPLVLKTTALALAAQSAQADLLAGRPPPSGDPPPVLHAPRPSVMPVLAEPRAQAAFLRMMARAAQSVLMILLILLSSTRNLSSA